MNHRKHIRILIDHNGRWPAPDLATKDVILEDAKSLALLRDWAGVKPKAKPLPGEWVRNPAGRRG
jgi:hypothetical protein